MVKLTHMQGSKLIITSLVFFISISVLLSFEANGFSSSNKENITLTVIFNEFSQKGWGKSLVEKAFDELKSNHQNLNLNFRYIEFPYKDLRGQLLKVLANQTPIDVISVDQIWLGEFAEKGLLTDLMNETKSWGRISDLYESNIDGMTYNNSIYGVWAWTDVRGIWYWKDLLNEVGVDPNLLKIWDGYIESAEKLNSVLRPRGIEGVHLTGASHSLDLWYPY